MILRRLTTNLRAQNWTAIAIEFVIVVLGVFIGTQVSNWNQARVERGNTIRLLDQFKGEIRYQVGQYEFLNAYMATTGKYARVALAGWQRDPEVSDNEFVIAAYQASQVAGAAINTQNWASIFGSGQVQNIHDPVLRGRLIRVLSLDSSVIDYHQVQSEYREHVRRLIPDDVQSAIRARCGDRFQADGSSAPFLPPTCDLVLPADRARATAAALRAHPELVDDLNWHRSLVATMLDQYRNYAASLNGLGKAINQSGQRQ
jgi:hypothetical protein